MIWFPIVCGGPLSPSDWIQLAIAVFTLFAAIAAMIAAWSSDRAAQASLYSQLMDQYGSPEMLEALRQLILWRNQAKHNRDAEVMSFHEVVDEWATAIQSPEPSQPIREQDIRRRRVTYFYSVVARLIDERRLSAGFAADLRSLSGREVLCEIVLPMERALRKARNARPDDGGAELLKRLERLFCS